MFETTITLKPEAEWRPGMTYDRLVAAMDSAVRLPGVTNAWTMPIKGRIDMLATGIRTPVGIKIFGPDLAELERLGKRGRAGGADGAGHPERVRGARGVRATTSTSTSTGPRRPGTGSTWATCRP